MPLGLKIILVFSILGMLFALWSMAQGTYQFIVVVPKGTQGIGELITILMLVAQVAWIVSVLKRYKWGWKLFLTTNTLTALNVILGEIIQEFNVASIAVYLTLALMIVISLYVYKVRSYFIR